MATRQQKHPGTQFVQQQELDEQLKAYPTIQGTCNFVNKVVPQMMLDLLESEAFNAKVIELVSKHAAERLGGERPSGIIMLPESSL